MVTFRRRTPWRYGLVLLAVAAALVIHWALRGWFGELPAYSLFYPLVVLVAMFAGPGPGLLATVLAAATIDLWLLPPDRPRMQDAVAIAVFSLVGVLVSVAAARYHAMKGRLVHYEGELAARDAQQRYHEQAIHASEERWRTLLDCMPAAVQGYLPDGTIIYWNRASESLYGYTQAQAVGENLLELIIPPAIRSHFQQVLADAAKIASSGEFAPAGELVLQHRSGVPVRVYCTHTAVRVPDSPILLFHLDTDLSERYRAEEALRQSEDHLRQALHIAEDAGRAKDQFLAALSHELRTPLTPVLATASMLRADPDLPARFRPDIEMIRRNVESEARLIDDLLDVTRITRGKARLERRPIDLCEVVCRAIEVCRSEISARNLQFGFDAGPESHCLVEADPARLEQVFWNLIRNAVKFTPRHGRVSIRARCADGRVSVEVCDTGAGIDSAVLSRLFVPFEQGGATVTRRFGGLGLGLAISKGIVEMHGGVILATSPGPGQGATFTVELPLISIPNVAMPATSDHHSAIGVEPSRGAVLRILVVEDHADTAWVLGRVLSAHGHQVHTAGDIATALQQVHQDPPDLLISDLGLPDGSGLDLMRQLRDRGSTIPAIALSGYGQEQDIERSRCAGFSAHLIKPVDVAGLMRVVHSFSPASTPADADADEATVTESLIP